MTHVKIVNRAFTKLTGIKWVCLLCGQTNENAEKVCPGKRSSSVIGATDA